MEEIDDIDGDSTDPFVAAAVANEKELALSEEQKKNYKKVRQFFLLLVGSSLDLVTIFIFLNIWVLGFWVVYLPMIFLAKLFNLFYKRGI